MSKFFVYLLSLFILLSLNMVFPTFLGGAPNFLFLLVIFYAFRKDNPTFLWLAFFSGLLLDLFSGGFFGAYAISFLSVSVIMNYTTRSFLSADLSTEFMSVLIFVSYFFMLGLVYLVNSFAIRLGLTQLGISPAYLVKKVWIDVVFNLIFAIPIYFLTVLNDRIISFFEKPKNIL